MQWLHLTVMPIGFSEDFTDASINEMIACANQLLSSVSPITVTFGEIWYHPEAIVLGIKPVRALDPLLTSVRDASKSATGQDSADDDSSWAPHVTLAYSTATQPAGPIIATLGNELPDCDITIKHVSLVVQKGPERLWNWHPIAKVSLSRS
jgi:2'-5' RNA ligase